MKEIWKEINEYPNYMVSNMGRVKSLDKYVRSKNNSIALKKGRILKPSVNKIGYLLIGLWKNGKQKFFTIHRLVAKAFVPNPNNYPQVNHKNEIKDDNRAENLEWCDAKYNNNYGTRLEKITNGKCSKPVLQINKTTNEVIAEFPSIKEVERQLGISHISECCKGGFFCKKRNKWVNVSQAHGFKWQYKKEDY